MQLAKCTVAICSIPASALAQCDATAYDAERVACAATTEQSGRRGDDIPPSPMPIGDGPATAVLPEFGDEAMLLKTARYIVATRNRRARHFRSELFAEPAWDMMLDLFIAHLERRQVYVSALCLSANAPSTTALRYIQDLERHGEIIGMPDPRDGRRRWLRLSDTAFAGMRELIVTIAALTPKG